MIAYGMLYAAAVGLPIFPCSYRLLGGASQIRKARTGRVAPRPRSSSDISRRFLDKSLRHVTGGIRDTRRNRFAGRSLRHAPRNRRLGVTRRGCRPRRVGTWSRRNPVTRLATGLCGLDAEMVDCGLPAEKGGRVLARRNRGRGPRLADFRPRASRLRDYPDAHPGAVMVGVAAARAAFAGAAPRGRARPGQGPRTHGRFPYRPNYGPLEPRGVAPVVAAAPRGRAGLRSPGTRSSS